MPRYIRSPKPASPKHDKLVHKLAQEIKSPSKNLMPVILEDVVPSTKSRHVQVIWDAWRDVADEHRAAVIVDAYTKAEGPEAAAEVTLASGVTPQEALALGLLPFKVVANRKRTDPTPLEDYESAVVAEAKNTLLGAKARELRYPRLEDAEEARTRLEAALPGSSWAVVQEVDYEP